MRALALLFLAAGCSQSSGWTQEIVSLPAGAEDVVSAVAALPECEAVRRSGGVIRWHPTLTCNASPAPVAGCTYPFRDPPEVNVVYRASAWDGPPDKPRVSTLAHELCHVCGYVVGSVDDYEAQADACAMRARLTWFGR